MPLTDLKIRSAKAKDQRYRLADAEGLYIEVMASGKKYFRLRYSEGNKRRWHTIGEYPTVSLQEARERRNELRKRLHDGEPLVKMKETTNTFAGVALEWADKHEQAITNAKEKHNTRRRLELHILPFIGEMPIDQINPLDVLHVLQRLEARGNFASVAKIRQIISQIFRYGVATARCTSDPTYAIKGAIVVPRQNHFASITNPEEVGALMRAIAAYPYNQVRLALQFSALTFARPGEIRHAEWTEIKDDEWRIPAEKMKMRRPHIVPLATQALEVLQQMRDLTGHGRYIFPNNRAPHGDRPMSENTVLVALRSMGYTKDQMTAHGFRSMASTLLNENGFSPDWIERQLAHVEGNSVRAAYNYAEYLPERRKMMQWWADYLNLLENSSTLSTGT